LIRTDQVRAEIFAFLAEFRRRACENRDADAALLSEGRHAIAESRALLLRVAIDHPGL
jgi:hypothetical protein